MIPSQIWEEECRKRSVPAPPFLKRLWQYSRIVFNVNIIWTDKKDLDTILDEDYSLVCWLTKGRVRDILGMHTGKLITDDELIDVLNEYNDSDFEDEVITKIWDKLHP